MVISIIIPTYNEALVIKKTIEHLQKHLLNKDYEIIIWCWSTDETVQIAEKLE
jgi:glycosyltransferase involved in cell wall biosynthesis